MEVDIMNCKQKRFLQFWVIVFVISLFFLPFTHNDKAAAEEKVVLGAVLTLHGPAGAVGLLAKEGIELALDEINAKGGVDGRKIELVVEDDEGNPAKSATAMTKVIQKHNAVAVLGASITVTTVAAAQVAKAEKVVVLSPTFTGDQLTAPGTGNPYVFRVGAPDRYTIGKLVEAAAKRYNKIGVFTDSGPAGQSITKIAKKRLGALGKSPVGTQTFVMRSPDVTPQLMNLRKAGAEALIAQAVPGDAPTIAKGMRQIGYKAQIFGHLGFAAPIFRILARDAAEGVITVDTVDPGKPQQKKLLQLHKKKYNPKKVVYRYALFGGYDAMMVMAEALKRAYFQRDAVKSALESIKDFPAVSGNSQNRIGFSPDLHDGNRENSVILLQIRGMDVVKME
jgi:branched-chain amino acid transport system substrate-binding protein